MFLIEYELHIPKNVPFYFWFYNRVSARECEWITSKSTVRIAFKKRSEIGIN